VWFHSYLSCSTLGALVLIAVSCSCSCFVLQINLDANVCRIAPKMLRIQYLVSVNHLTKFGKNRPVTVREMLINFLKSASLQWWKKWKSDPESTSGFRSMPCIITSLAMPTVCLVNVQTHLWVILLTDRQTERTTDRETATIA